MALPLVARLVRTAAMRVKRLLCTMPVSNPGVPILRLPVETLGPLPTQGVPRRTSGLGMVAFPPLMEASAWTAAL
jgi:hypothetical protein